MRDPDAVRLDLASELPQAVSQLGGGATAAQRVVLADERNPEDGHHRVADELLDRAAVPLEHLASISKKRDITQRTDSGSSPRRARRARHVREYERDDLAGLVCDRSRQLGAAEPAQPEAVGILLVAVRADHGRKRMPAGCCESGLVPRRRSAGGGQLERVVERLELDRRRGGARAPARSASRRATGSSAAAGRGCRCRGRGPRGRPRSRTRRRCRGRRRPARAARSRGRGGAPGVVLEADERARPSPSPRSHSAARCCRSCASPGARLEVEQADARHLVALLAAVAVAGSW